MGYLAFNLTDSCRTAILSRRAPRFTREFAHHVTVQFGVPEGTLLPPAPETVRVVGEAIDEMGVEALIIEINGSTTRPDGATYHLTYSLADGRKPVQSNDVIKTKGWVVIEPFDLQVEPRWNK